MTDPVALTRESIRALLGEVAEELTGVGQRSIVVVGGSLLAWHGMRDSTLDVDSIERIDSELRGAVRRVGQRHGLAPDWLNDHARAFAPDGFDIGACEVLVDAPQLRVLGAPFRDVFLMKLRRGLPQDLVDMRALWPEVASDFSTAAEIVAVFYEAFPVEPNDPHLGRLVVEQLAKDGVSLPLD